MRNLNNSGFTLVEVIAVVVIIAILGLIAVPNVINTINTSNQASYDILVENITVASKQLFEEIDFVGTSLYHYDSKGKTGNKITIEKDLFKNDIIYVNLQTLVSNGFFTGSNNPNSEVEGSSNENYKIITNPKTKEDIGACEITITKVVDENFNTSYTLTNNSTNNNCPTSDEYNRVLN